MRHALTKNLWRHELKCKCNKCGLDTMDFETINVVQDCCDHFSRQLKLPRVHCSVHSAHRCPTHNEVVGGSVNSQHLYGRAIDFSIRGVAPIDVYNYLNREYPDKYGISDYETFVHLDTRTGPAARW